MALNMYTENPRYSSAFTQRILNTACGHDMALCMQCGLCSVTCPTIDLMDYSPRYLFNLIKKGEEEKVLSSNTMWMCTSCYTCKVRCPRGISIADVMHDLKYLALTEGKARYDQMEFYESFWKEVQTRGKSFEAGLMMRFYMQKCRDGLMDTVMDVMELKDLGINMLKHFRLSVTPPPKVKGQKQLLQIVEKAQEMQRKGEV